MLYRQEDLLLLMLKSIPKIRLGRFLVDHHLITEEQLNAALAHQQQTWDILGVTLLKLGVIKEDDVFMSLLAKHLGVSYKRLAQETIAPEAIDQVPAKFVSHYQVMPIHVENGHLTVATTAPLDVHTIDEMALVLGVKIKTVLSRQKDILEGIRQHYGLGAQMIESMMGREAIAESASIEEIAEIDEEDSDASISQFLNKILLEAFSARATDVHIEPFEDVLQIRYRIDGMLIDAKVPSNIKYFKDAINSRIKILAHLDIAEKRLPQDGRFKVRVGAEDLDLRVSFLPTLFGESVVMRLLNATNLYQFADLGMTTEENTLLEHLIAKPHGIIFLTGPTGSGKTTTLYSCLSRINSGERKIITIEDPVEYQLKGVTQIQVNAGIGLTFANGLRSLLRHDPDIMMIGEVRDTETADIAIQVALTGHLIFSTLHTNDAAGGIARLLDMGVDPYLITSTVECFIAQRLVRVICPQCKVALSAIPRQVQVHLGAASVKMPEQIFEGKGCEACHMTGYVGRTGIYEFLLLDDALRHIILQRADAGQIKSLALARGMKTLEIAGWQKVRDGVTTVQEVLRVTQEDLL